MGPEMSKSETGKSIRQYNAAEALVALVDLWSPRVDHTSDGDPLRPIEGWKKQSINFCEKV